MKLFVSDYDMTLFINYIVDDKVINAIKKWREKGNIFAIATGRNKFSILEQTDNNNIEFDYIIANNGALIIDSNTNLILKEEIDINNAIEIINFLYNTYEGSVEISNENETFSIIPKKGEHNLPFKVDKKITIEEAKNIKSITQINKISPDVNKTEIIQDEINNKFNTVIAYGNITAIDIVKANISKATGIKNLENILKDKNIEKILVAGDSNNDIDMIKKYDGYVQINAREHIKKITNKYFNLISDIIGSNL
ncbi:HAD-IIB family hydrolase [Brachyspira pilosicoli]|uniref:HAD-IIB family hydrolase n=1 Tax=Brachyspira pilosicoli TaxID=52584 RepID=A0A5C8EU02_BRAPL|nr:HAD-IIB family hydrolase [Brachyspira pilosicoli]TXJ40411.1 HAD-IIB family hydrolase [Brachyspira pilosicoli]